MSMLLSPAIVYQLPTPELVINEIDYDRPSTDTAVEFVEIRNDGVRRRPDWSDVGDQRDVQPFTTLNLPAVSLASGDYCGVRKRCNGCQFDLHCPDTDLIQNGAPDAGSFVQCNFDRPVSYEAFRAPFRSRRSLEMPVRKHCNTPMVWIKSTM